MFGNTDFPPDSSGSIVRLGKIMCTAKESSTNFCSMLHKESHLTTYFTNFSALFLIVSLMNVTSTIISAADQSRSGKMLMMFPVPYVYMTFLYNIILRLDPPTLGMMAAI